MSTADPSSRCNAEKNSSGNPPDEFFVFCKSPAERI
jgi:hypothetical protein